MDEKARKLIIELNTDDQLGLDGIDSLGDTLGEYAPFTVEQRRALGLQTGYIDFKVTGDYWNSWRVRVNASSFTIEVDRDRFDELVNQLNFSEDHVGLTSENKSKLGVLLLVNYQHFVRKELGII